MKFSSLVEHVTKKPLPPHVQHFVVEVMASDEDGEDVEVRSAIVGPSFFR
jgi:ubiquitin-activating enzyme E1